jgi:hypothetical protein
MPTFCVTARHIGSSRTEEPCIRQRGMRGFFLAGSDSALAWYVACSSNVIAKKTPVVALCSCRASLERLKPLEIALEKLSAAKPERPILVAVLNDRHHYI